LITTQFSLYPLRTQHLGPVLDAAMTAIRETGGTCQVGLMSTVMEGTEEELFAALRAAFAAAAAHGDVVLVASVSNACDTRG